MKNSRSLADLRADVRANVETLLEMCAEQGLSVLITQTVRDDEYQAYLYAQGRTRPGAVITNSKTTTFHGKGLAIDFCQNLKGHEYDDGAFFQNVAILAKAIGFSWGGDWASFPDFPHLQWDNKGRYTTAMLRAGKEAPQMPRYIRKKDEEEEDDMRRYQTTAEIKKNAPWALATVEKLIERKALNGNGTGLDLSEDMLRAFVINDRMGAYK